MGRRPEWCSEAPVRGRGTGRDEARRLREHPGPQATPGRVDDSGGADDLAGGPLWRSAVNTDESNHTFTPGPTPNTVQAADGTVKTAPEGWVLLPPGDAALTRRVKAAGDHWVVQEKKGRKTFSRGVWASAATIDRIHADLDAERSTEGFAKKKEADARRREKAQAVYVE